MEVRILSWAPFYVEEKNMCNDPECIYKKVLEMQIESTFLSKDRADFLKGASAYPGFDLGYKPPSKSVVERAVRMRLNQMIKFWIQYIKRT